MSSMSPTSLNWLNILWTSNVDGPGTRVVLYLRECHLRCPWCHSPHSRDKDPTLLFFKNRCLLCGTCVTVCKQSVHYMEDGEHHLHRELCLRCGTCVRYCPVSAVDSFSGALVLPNNITSPHVLYKKLRPQLTLLKRIGGLTVSGGEPLLQSRELRILLSDCRKDGIHTAVETSGALPKVNFNHLIDVVDCWLYGLRPVGNDMKLPGQVADFKTVVRNLRFLSQNRNDIIIRMPLIPGITTSENCLMLVAETLGLYGLSKLELLLFNPLTSHYYYAMGMNPSLPDLTVLPKSEIDRISSFFKEMDINAKVVG